MKNLRAIACLLIFCALAMGLGMALNHHVYWFVVDIVVILACAISGIYLLIHTGRTKTQR